MAVALETLTPEKNESTYFAFRVPTDMHRQMRALLAQRGISGQAFFLRVVEDLLHQHTSEGESPLVRLD